MFNEVLAVDVLTDLSYYTQDVLKLLVPEIHPSDRHNFCDIPADQDDNDLENSVYYLRAPRNTILGIDFAESQEIPIEFLKPSEALMQIILADKENVSKLKVYYPFFSSHLCLPVKPGESIWTFESNGINYWITRVSQPLPVEDPNFTHRERKWTPVRQTPIKVTQGESGYQEFKPEEGQDLVIGVQPSFPLGPGFSVRDSNIKEKIESLAEETEKLENDPDAKVELSNTVFLPDNLTFFMLPADSEIKTRSVYDFYYKTNKDRNAIAYEPVPRLNKRPGDLVIQGSNNSSIVLGTERADTWRRDNIPDGTKTNVLPIPESEDADPTPLEGKRGIIDIVAGRGRIDQDYSSDNIKDKDPAGTTRPRVIQNTREDFETHKNLGLDENIMTKVPPDPDSGNLYDVPEGDPDFLHDASRVYVSMKSSPDELLFGQTAGETGVYPLTPEVGASNEGQIVSRAEDAASIIVKSDEVRIVARQRDEGDPVDGAPEINGSIRIVKEGIPDDRNGAGSAAILMLPDGTIMIDGPKIVLGSGFHAEDDGHGGGQQLSLGVGATEPIVLGNELKTKLEALIDEIKLITVPTPAGPSGMPNNGAAFDAIKNDLSCILSKLGKTL